jgi:RimJ/RimL family protein N-acetyltransferase
MAWDESGLALLQAMNTPAGKAHLGGPETGAKTLDRHQRYLTYHDPGEGEMLMISADGEIVGSVGYWARDEKDERVYEMGWELIPAFHGRGLGTSAASALLRRLQPIAKHRYVYAYPTPANAGSNGICRKLGFELIGTDDFEYPKGVFSPHNIWRLDLPAWAPPGG